MEIRQEYEFQPFAVPEEMEALGARTRRRARQQAPRAGKEYTSLLEAAREIRQAALLGDPGGGKSAALRKIEVEAIERARRDPDAPIPLFVALRGWLDAQQPLEALLAATAPELRDYLPTLAKDKRLTLLRAASLLDSAELVSFSHHLLQEYFAALRMRGEIEAGRLRAEQLWPNAWERTGWEEATVLLAGLDAELAGECIARGGGSVSDATRAWLRDLWLQRLTDPMQEPHPYARAAAGRALAVAELDSRPGVGVLADGTPDIAWVDLEGGDFPMGGDEEAFQPLPQRRKDWALLSRLHQPGWHVPAGRDAGGHL